MTANDEGPDRSPCPISDRLREVIAARELRASQLARAAGVDPGMVRRFLLGDRGLSLATADKLAAALGLKVIESDVDHDEGGLATAQARPARRSGHRRPK
ncbi:helix-turn-helix domain-containing protein [Singulisphaera acidiphila]|uniref:Helix-turn-helix protein n=1 Tax=Singulisphaera acidiphila (strain ATCC BAA-1392 / DSM 18658 / VKM B-2454 / MOB10) TaxID=886293 RepID=L0D7B3_SINAD|nr:helix-turn-helix transcriptional regulator [Singulisphaera acidiphila]AGA25132.1 Helix-turn-helix protein [Singulisphaera acidiphila DSM 18658]